MADPNNIAMHDLRLVLMLVCKAGNTSVKKAFAGALDLDRRIDLVLPTINKRPAREMREEGYLLVSVVRHPLARLASCWADKVVCPDRFHRPFARKYGAAIWPGMGFDAFVRFVAGLDDGIADQHVRSMAWDLVDDEGIVPGLVLRQEESCWWQQLRVAVHDHCGLDIGPELRVNASDPERIKGIWTDELRALAQERYRQDMEVFGYA